ncbi:Verru_Chthon cassette protein A [Verrucomicrobium sp. GAS474]|uniref:Verru_Chthon cassette protein A n=1 Tax=Verrucomicrobium sp. GAS474 TaxID=1882831 RepID=UPI00087A3112|nr:Verru_Chthon cassette protein A [Verrucomicrobium sp. GAS474]SDT92804.1 Verru_Chthon cassette protein A [Verrucomicrobium sp. GAS474]
MKTNSLLRPRRSGFALLLVLGMLVLIVGLSVGFLMKSTSALQSASGYGASVSARNLAYTAVGLVQGQINLATGQGTSVAWVSQPGMVRTYDNAGTLRNAYKLYSAANMIDTKVSITGGVSADAPAASWKDNPALWTDLNAPVQTRTGKVYPILDGNVGTGGNLKPEGYSLGAAPGASSWQPVPMPVRWLYVLQDGTFVAAAGSGNEATVAGATAANPVVGRIAFWTDDETCKVNINTASEGMFWNTPHFYSNFQRYLGQYQPAQGEYQRYPGHPATTCLSSVFTTLSADNIYALTPRVSPGGSSGATTVATGPVAKKSQRLYASVDELAFDPSFDSSRTATPKLKASDIAQAHFFATASSRAPELNLFNLPRIACWPLYAGLATGKVTSLDKLIAFCSSTGNGAASYPYYFQRQRYDSPTNDIGLARNGTLYNYLRALTSQAVPGFGGLFSAKYGADRDQILTEIFDYIRTTNLYDLNLATGGQFTPASTPLPGSGHGWVAPTQYTTAGGIPTQGFGRFYTLSALTIGFACSNDPSVTTVPANTTPYASPALTPAVAGERYVQAILIPNFFSPMLGFTSMIPDMQVNIKGLLALRLNGQQLFTADSYDQRYNVTTASVNNGLTVGGHATWRNFDNGAPLYPFVSSHIKVTVPANGLMAFTGGQLTVTITEGAGGPVLQTLNINLPSSDPAGGFPIPKLVDQKFGAPDMSYWWGFGGKAWNENKRLLLSYGSGYSPGNYATPSCGSPLVDNYDVVRSVQPAHGDFRLVAAQQNVPTTVFAKHPYYDTTTTKWAANLFEAYSTYSSQGFDPGRTQNSWGSYFSTIPASSYFWANVSPDIPAGATVANTPESTGDYDSGFPYIPDGPYINKPDEGTKALGGANVPYFDTPWNASDPVTSTFAFPNRQMPSPGMFGSLPTGVKANVPWRTLLFRPQPTHFGATSPTDHLLLDLFWMPVVDPYAISDRFSTAGKINMNYQILPFTYIERSTGINALLKSELVTAVPNTGLYKAKGGNSTMGAQTIDYPIDATETLTQFKAKFQGGDIFRSASEICDLHIVPVTIPATTVNLMKTTFWTANQITGENLRERIYTTLYPRLTTKSNTYTVHFRAQSLKKNVGSLPGTWREGVDQITGEYRGSATIERFIDANNASIPDYGTNPNATPSLDTFYRWRIVHDHQFAP